MTQIVVGIDGSDNSRRALLRAVEEGALRNATVVAAHIYRPVTRSFSEDLIELPHGVAASMGTIDAEDRTQHDLSAEREAQVEAERRLEHFVTDVLGETDTGKPECVAIARRHAAEALIDLSKTADLLVVGTRGLGGIRGMLLGSVANQCVQRSHCPVLVLPPENG